MDLRNKQARFNAVTFGVEAITLERGKPRKACVKCGDDEDQGDMVSCVGCEAGPWHSDCLEGGSARGQDSYQCKKCLPGKQMLSFWQRSVLL